MWSRPKGTKLGAARAITQLALALLMALAPIAAAGDPGDFGPPLAAEAGADVALPAAPTPPPASAPADAVPAKGRQLFPAGTAGLESGRGTDPAERGAQTGLLSMAAPLATVLVVAGICIVVLRRAFALGGGLAGAVGPGGKAPAGILEVLGRYPLARGQTLILLRLDRRVLLLSHGHGGRAGGAGLSTLAELTSPEEVASILLKVQEAADQSASRQFAEMVARAQDGDGMPAEGPGARQRRSGAEGDAVEMWDDSVPARSDSAAERRLTAADPVRSLRDRIAAMKAGPGAAQEAAA